MSTACAGKSRTKENGVLFIIFEKFSCVSQKFAVKTENHPGLSKAHDVNGFATVSKTQLGTLRYTYGRLGRRPSIRA